MYQYIIKIMPKSAMEFARKYKARFSMYLSRLRYHMTGKKELYKDFKDIPIIINNYNRLTFLQELIDSLTCRGYSNIVIIDNNSTYPPLLEWYQKCPYKVHRLNKNIGFCALWETYIYREYQKSYYVYTDSDMKLSESCPKDFMKHLVEVLKKYPMAQKVGLGLRIDDLPDSFRMKYDVIKHESQFWKIQREPELYVAAVDTTFALYRPYCGGQANIHHETYRTGFPYLIHHLPWYVDSDNLDEEEKYYIAHVKTSTHWSKQTKK